MRASVVLVLLVSAILCVAVTALIAFHDMHG